ncbi:MAG TPA: PilZ domain-containing protein [Candidatus Saccharimonadales bacterium]|nr:PilZ domain-containing protein [Candidatus Saccharimonadales bacterium]
MPSTPVNSERRKNLRRKPLRLIYVELAFGNGGMMRDLSEEGFAVRAMMPLKQGGTTHFSFMLSDTSKIEGEGEISWVDEGGRVAGVLFTQISPQMRLRIDDWLIEEERTTEPGDADREPRIADAPTLEALKEEIRSTPVRAATSAPLFAEEPSVDRAVSAEEETRLEDPALAPAEPSEIPKVEVASKLDAPTKEQNKPASPRPAPPKILGEPDKPQVTSITEGFSRKWPKEPPFSPLNEKPAPSELPPALTSETLSQSDVMGEVEIVVPRGDTLPLRDISEVLIQPRAVSRRHDAATHRPLPDLPAPQRTQRTDREWFTLGRAVATMVVLTILVAALVYHQAVGNGLILLGEAIGGTSNDVANTPPINAANNASASPNSASTQTQPAQPPATVSTPTIPPTGAPSEPPPLASPPRSANTPATPLSSSGAGPDSGEAEYQQAAQLMRGRHSESDAAEAVRLLWIAVEKGNPGAEISLADLYWRGKGVGRNCDQARILFTAAARKGGAEAQKRLQQFQREGCE